MRIKSLVVLNKLDSDSFTYGYFTFQIRLERSEGTFATLISNLFGAESDPESFLTQAFKIRLNLQRPIVMCV